MDCLLVCPIEEIENNCGNIVMENANTNTNTNEGVVYMSNCCHIVMENTNTNSNKTQIQIQRQMKGGAGVKLLSYFDGEAPGGRSLCVLNCQRVMEGHPSSSAQLPRQIHNQQIRPGRAQSKFVKIQIQPTWRNIFNWR